MQDFIVFIELQSENAWKYWHRHIVQNKHTPEEAAEYALRWHEQDYPRVCSVSVVCELAVFEDIRRVDTPRYRIANEYGE